MEGGWKQIKNRVGTRWQWSGKWIEQVGNRRIVNEMLIEEGRKRVE